MAAFDYSLKTPNFGLAFQQMQEQFAAQQEAKLARQQALELQQVLGQLPPNAPPEKYIELVQRYPKAAKPLAEQYSTYDGAKKTAMYDAGQRAFMQLAVDENGNINPAGSVQSLRSSAEAFRNSRMEDMAKFFEIAASQIEKNPANARNAIGLLLAASDAEKTKKMNEAMGPSELTSFQKDLVASGVDPKSDEGREFSKRYVQNRADPIVTMETPTGAQFIGPMSEYQRRYGQQPPATSKLPVLKNKAEYDALPSGAQFVAPDGSVRKKP
jgi:hypothetical protein